MKLHLAIVPILAVLVAAYVLLPRATPLSAPYTQIGSPTYRTQIGVPSTPSAVWTERPLSGDYFPAPVTGGAPTPRPTGGIGEPASYCKPGYCETPKPSPLHLSRPGASAVVGTATWWYSFGPGIYAALRPDLGSKGDVVIVCGGAPFHCLTLEAITTCACLGPNSDRLIDLSRDAFSSFADPSRGVVRIVLQVIHR